MRGNRRRERAVGRSGDVQRARRGGVGGGRKAWLLVKQTCYDGGWKGFNGVFGSNVKSALGRSFLHRKSGVCYYGNYRLRR